MATGNSTANLLPFQNHVLSCTCGCEFIVVRVRLYAGALLTTTVREQQGGRLTQLTDSETGPEIMMAAISARIRSAYGPLRPAARRLEKPSHSPGSASGLCFSLSDCQPRFQLSGPEWLLMADERQAAQAARVAVAHWHWRHVTEPCSALALESYS